jgi:hypothetical protein
MITSTKKVGRPPKYRSVKPMAIQLNTELSINPRARRQSEPGRPSKHHWPLLSLN